MALEATSVVRETMPKQKKDAKLTKAEQEAVGVDEQSAAEIAKTGRVPGQFIFSKERKPQRILGSICFADGKVSSITRPIGDEDFAPWSQDAVGLARTLYRALAPTTGDSVNSGPLCAPRTSDQRRTRKCSPSLSLTDGWAE